MFGRQRWITWLLVAGFLFAQPVVWLAEHHDTLISDAACAVDDGSAFVGPHHMAGAQIEAPTPASPVDHCVFCHLHRAFGSARQARAALLVPPSAHAATARDESVAPASAVLSHYDPRGPPATHS